MKKFRKNKKGFTLVEVVVVLVIIAILIAIAVPSVMKYIDDANEAKYLAEARAVYIATEAELTKDYADNKKVDFSIYGTDKTGADFLKEVSDASSVTTTKVTVYTSATANVPIDSTKKGDQSIKPNAVVKYVVEFTSPSSNDPQTVTITKNGTATLGAK